MRYKIFRLTGIAVPDPNPIIFIEKEDGVVRYSDDKEEDEFFANWYKDVAKESPEMAGFEDVTSGFSYYDCESGEYSGKAKIRIDALTQEMGYSLNN